MKKRYVVGLATGLMAFGLAGGAGATLTTVGTALYDSDGDGTKEVYNLIYDADSPFGPITWLDYTRWQNWQNLVNWASGLGASLTVNLLPGYTTTNDWATDWRLPSTVDGFSAWAWDRAGYNINSSEMSHLYYTELGNKWHFDANGNSLPGNGLNNKEPFDNLRATWYRSGTEFAAHLPQAWTFDFYSGNQCPDFKEEYYIALSVRPGQVSPIPEPATMLLFGTGIAGLVGTRLRRKK